MKRLKVQISLGCILWPIVLCFKRTTWVDKCLWHWLDELENLKFKDIASEMQSFENLTIADQIPMFKGPFPCHGQQNKVQLEGRLKFDKEGKVTGKGKVSQEFTPKTVPLRSPQRTESCYALNVSVTKIKGQFSKGKLQGKGILTYNDKTKMEANFHQNIVHGPVLIRNKHNTIQALGYYENGQAHGPFWFIHDSTFLQVHFCHGETVEENVILVDADTRHVDIGTLQNGTFLKNVRRISEIETEKYLSIVTVKIPPNDSLIQLNNQTQPWAVKLPLKIIAIPSNQRLIVRPSRIMYFNRVAKTGTLSMLMLMKSLGVHLGYDVDLGFRLDGSERLQDDHDGLSREVDSLVQTHKDTIKARHYAFFDVTNWGYNWIPVWFSIVRDPIERVRSKELYRVFEPKLGKSSSRL